MEPSTFYPDPWRGAGSHIVYAGQAFRRYVLDPMERQVYPDRWLDEGGPPEPPYDLAGWTLPIDCETIPVGQSGNMLMVSASGTAVRYEG